MAHRFIVGESPQAALKPIGDLWRSGIDSSVDLLGEATVTEGEAERYAYRLLVLADGELLFTGTPAELETATGGTAAAPDFETAFVAFLHDRGH